MADTNLKVIDLAVKTLTFERYKSYLDIVDVNEDAAICPKGVAQRMIAEKRTEATLEFINVWRTATRRAPDRERTFLARRGLPVQYTTSSEADVQVVKAMPVNLEYSIWFWSKDKDKLNAVTEKAIFWKHQDPNLNINFVSSLGDLPLEYDLHFGDIVDESPVEEMFDKGLYFVVRLDMSVDGWVFDEDIARAIWKVILKVYDDIDPGGPHERDILLFEQEYT